MNYLKAFIINLKRSVDRRTHMEQVMSSLPLEYEFVEAVDGRALTDEYLKEIYDEKACMRAINRPLSKNEVACALSHIKAWNMIKDNNLKMALIFEDDAFIKDKEAFLKVLDQYALYPENWELILFGRGMLPYAYPSYPSLFHTKRIYKNYNIVRFIGFACGAYGYLLTSLAVKKLLEVNQYVSVPIDLFTGLNRTVDTYAIHPVLVDVSNRGKMSLLDEDRYDVTGYISRKKQILKSLGLLNIIKYFYYQWRRIKGSFKALKLYDTRTLLKK